MKSKRLDTTFMNIMLLLVLSFGLALIIYANLHHIKEGFEDLAKAESKPKKTDPFPEVDAVIYINLDSRKDRNEEILAEINRVAIPESKVYRFSAVKRSWGALGCALSHIGVLKFVKERGWQRTLVLEDDAGFEDKNQERWDAGVKDIRSMIQSSGNTNLDSTWDVIFLGGFVRDPKGPTKTQYPTIFNTKNTSCTHAYIIRNEYAQKVIEHTEMAVQMMMKQAPNLKQYNLDNAWSQLMAQDRWFISIPTIAYQRESYSDIEGKNANADEPLRGQVVRAWKAGTILN